MSTRIINGDCLIELLSIADCSIDSCVTDPPYHLTTGKKGGTGPASVNLESPYGRARVTTGFMGMKWDGGDIAHNPALWAEVLRVLKPGGFCLSFAGTRTYHRMACAIEDAGFEIRDMIGWLYGSGFPKGTDKAKIPAAWKGWNTALKPALEPLCFARKPMEGTLAQNLEKWGTGAIWIDGCRIDVDDESYARNFSGDRGHDGTRGADETGATNMRMGGGTRPLREARRNQESDANRNTFAKGLAGSMAVGETSLGRWPANLIHDGSEEVLACFPDAPGQIAPVRPDSGTGQKTDNIFGAFATNSDHDPRGDKGSAARFFYCSKASRQDRNDGLQGMPEKLFGMSGGAAAAAARGEHYDNGDSGMNRTTMRANNHPTVKPTDLMRYLCRLVTPKGGTVLDPFMGSGSTGRGAIREGFSFIGIEIDPEYCEIARVRIHADAPLFSDLV